MTGPRVAARAVTVAAPFGRVLDAVTLDVQAGSCLALLGPSGAGKTTLVRALALLQDPTGGAVHHDGAPVPRRGAGRRRVQRRVALVQQKPGLLDTSAAANVAFPLRVRGVAKAEALARARTQLAAVGLGARANARARVMSGGEQQRVAVARALATDPDLLLLDECTNQLDPDNEEAVERLVSEARDGGAAVVLVTHRAAQARRVADRVAFLHEGRVLDEGPLARVFDAPAAPLIRRFMARE